MIDHTLWTKIELPKAIQQSINGVAPTVVEFGARHVADKAIAAGKISATWRLR